MGKKKKHSSLSKMVQEALKSADKNNGMSAREILYSIVLSGAVEYDEKETFEFKYLDTIYQELQRGKESGEFLQIRGDSVHGRFALNPDYVPPDESQDRKTPDFMRPPSPKKPCSPVREPDQTKKKKKKKKKPRKVRSRSPTPPPSTSQKLRVPVPHDSISRNTVFSNGKFVCFDDDGTTKAGDAEEVELDYMTGMMKAFDMHQAGTLKYDKYNNGLIGFHIPVSFVTKDRPKTAKEVLKDPEFVQAFDNPNVFNGVKKTGKARKFQMKLNLAKTKLNKNAASSDDMDEDSVMSEMQRIVLDSNRVRTEKMCDDLRKAYVGHYFRRFMTKKSTRDWKRERLAASVKYPIIRQSFLSTNNIDVMREALNKSLVSYIPRHEVFEFGLSTWFLVKRLRLDIRSNSFTVLMSTRMFKTLYDIIRPSLFVLISDREEALQFGSLCETEEVMYMDSTTPGLEFGVEKVARYLTHLYYNDKISSFRYQLFPRVDTLVIPHDGFVSLKFLKSWKKHEWNITHIIADGDVPNLSSFERFKGVISDKVTRVSLRMAFDNRELFESAHLNLFKRNLETLKRVFPSLHSITGSTTCGGALWSIQFTLFEKIEGLVKKLIEHIDHGVKPEWCDEFNVLLRHNEQFAEECSIPPADIKLLEPVIKKCREQFPQLEWIRLRGPSKVDFSTEDMACFGMVEMKTSVMHVQIVLFACGVSTPGLPSPDDIKHYKK